MEKQSHTSYGLPLGSLKGLLLSFNLTKQFVSSHFSFVCSPGLKGNNGVNGLFVLDELGHQWRGGGKSEGKRGSEGMSVCLF